VLVGWLGQISLALGAFLAVGGAGAAIGANTLHLPFPLPILTGVLLSIPVSILIGLPALRLRGLHFAVVTLAFGLVAERAIAPHFVGTNNQLVKPGYLSTDRPLYYVFLALTVTTFAFAMRISSTKTGRAFRAVRDSETVAAAYGIQPTRTKLTGFVVSGAIAALAGTMVAYELGSVQTGYASVLFSITWLAYAVVGGITSLAGPLIAAVIFGLLPAISQGEVHAAKISHWPEVSAAGLLILIMAFCPQGLASMARFLRTRVSAHEDEPDEDLRAIETAASDERTKVGAPA
jgi:branched-chain amino acid transport system permease protein